MKIVKYFLIILIPLVIILGNFQYLIFNLKFYKNLYNQAGVYQSFPGGVVDDATYNLLDYFRGKNKLDHNFFSNQAILHLKDVKEIINFTSSLFYLSAVAVLALSIILIARKQSKALTSALIVSSVITMIFIILLSIPLFSTFSSNGRPAFGWDFLFTKFHQALFNNDLWLFSPDDNLIRLFPSEFFVLFANQLAMNILVTSGVIIISSFLLKKKFSI